LIKGSRHWLGWRNLRAFKIDSMKRILFFAGFVMAVVAASAQRPAAFELKGDVTKVKEAVDWIYLSYEVNGQVITDSSRVTRGEYSFSGNLAEPTQARLRAKYRVPMIFSRKRDGVILFIQPGKMGATSVDSFANITITGSTADEEYRKMEMVGKPFNDKLDALYKQSADARKNKDEEAIKKLEAQIDKTNEEANDKVYGAYAKQHPFSPIALYALRNWAGYDIDAAKVEPVFAALPLGVRNSPGGKEMAERIAIAKKSGVGQVAMDFTQPDTAGAPLTLSSLRGKYLLIDFWAIWCGPCRAENPNVVKAFAKYKGRGFHILGVSLDRPGAKEKWLKAIHDDGLNWSQVSDLQYWDNAVAKQYGIQAIPQNLLLDPTGKIIAKNLRGESLVQKLAEIFPD